MNADTITIKSLKLLTKIGVPAEERAVPQELEVDLIIQPPHDFDNMHDEIAATVDYHAICLGLEKFAARGERQLIETLANDIARWVLDNSPAAGVRVKLRKFILPQTRWVGVETTLVR